LATVSREGSQTAPGATSPRPLVVWGSRPLPSCGSEPRHCCRGRSNTTVAAPFFRGERSARLWRKVTVCGISSG
jgi:hypothetical protein